MSGYIHWQTGRIWNTRVLIFQARRRCRRRRCLLFYVPFQCACVCDVSCRITIYYFIRQIVYVLSLDGIHRRRSSTPVFNCIEEFHDSLPVMIKVQYQQHQNNNGSNIQVKVFECIKHQCQVKEEEYNGNIFRIQFAILVPMKKRVNKDCSDKLEKLDKKWNYRYDTKSECRKHRP